MPRLFVAVLVLLAVVTNGAFAQDATSTRPIVPTLTGESVASPLNCFDYYTFGSVSADLQSSVAQSVPGATLTFSGQVVSTNPYPLLNGTLYVKIFRKDEAVYSQGDGNPVIDQFVVTEGLTLPPNGGTPVSYDWKVPLNAEGGEYYAAYFFVTEKRYNLMGLSFTDDVIGNQAPFTIVTDTPVSVAKLSKINTTLNGIDHHFAAFPIHFSSDDTVKVETTITNPSDTAKSLPLQWEQYAWDGMHPKNHRFSQTDIVTLAAGETKTVSYEVRPQRESVVYIIATTQDNEAKSILNIRFARDGIEETRINFPAVTQFPLTQGKEATLFACAHSTNEPVVPGNILTLTLRDRNDQIIHQYRYEGDIRGEMGGFGDTFIPAMNVNYALLTATLERHGVIVEQVTTEYDCKAIDPSSCLPEPAGPSFFDTLKTHVKAIAFGVLGVIVVILVGTVAVKRRRAPKEKEVEEVVMTTPLK